MRKLTFYVLAMALSMLLWSAAAQAAPPRGDIPKLSELRIYFLHLANLDAAADKADAEGTSGDTAAWRRFEQENAGLTETEAALLKDVAFRCNRALEEDLEGQGPMEIVRQAADELRAVLGPSAFEAVSQRIKTFLRPAITNVPAAAAAGWGGGEDEEEIPIEIEVLAGPSVSVYSLLFKLQDGNYMANCGTAPNDAETLNQYAGGVTMACEVFGAGLPAPIQVPCGSSASSTTCSGTYPPAPPNRTRVLSATHGLRMKLVSNVCLIPSPVYYDPLAFCRTGRSAPNYVDDGDVPPLANGIATCWDPEILPSVCKIATSNTAQISFIEISPSESTAYPGDTVQFSTWMPAIWSMTTEGHGTIDNTGLYRAPDTITSEQTVTVKGCDAYAPGDCDTATVTLKPLQVQVSPTNRALPPTANLELTATILPSSAGQEIEWTATPELGTLSPEGNNKVSYTVFRDDLIPRTTEVTIKACVKPALAVCGIAKVTVEKLLFMVTAPKTKLAPGESVQVTAFVGNSSVPRNVVWTDPYPRGEGTLTEINPADPFIRIYKAPPFPIEFGINIEVCLEDGPGFCAYLHIDLGSELTIEDISSDTGRWQAGVLTPFTITGTGFTETTEVYFGDLDVTLTSVTDTTIRGKVNIVVPTTAIYPRLKQTYPTGGGRDITRSPIPVEPATLGVVPPTPQVQAGGTVNLTASCLTSTAFGCTSLELPRWTADRGTITPVGLIATYTAPATVTSGDIAAITACWHFGEQSRCAPAAVTLLPPHGVTVGPKTVSLEPGQPQLFTATVTGNPNTAVTWSIQPAKGSITQGGLYTAPTPFAGPATVTVTATSQADATKKDTATVTLVPAPLSVTSTASPAMVNLGTTVTWTATASGGTPPYQYAIFRKKAGTTSWIPALNTPVWQTGSSMSWTTGLSDAGTWEIRIGVRDANVPVDAPVLYDPGSVQVLAPLSITCPASPPFANPGTAITWTVTASGGTGTGRQYALFRRRAGTIPWTPDVTTPAWQTSNVLSWTPLAADVGTWDFYIWAKDSGTPPTQNAYGYAAGCTPGPVNVVTPLGLTTTPSPASAYYGQPITWTLTATGGDPATTQFAWGRRRVGATDWIPVVPVWQPGNVISWTPTSADVGAWEIGVVVRDGNTPPNQNGIGYAAYANPGNVNVVAPLTVSGTMSPAYATHGNTLTWTATASGGTSVGRQYAFFRRRSGTTPWTPDVTSPAWQTSNVMSWTPSAADVGAWDTYAWVKDSATPPTMNTYGYAAGYNPGGVQIVAPLGLTSTPSPALATHGNAITWTATATGGVPATTQLALRRRVTGTSTWTPASPAWQSGNVLSWTPAPSEVATWEISIWVRDGNTPPTMNGSGYAGSYNPGSVQVVAPLTVTGTSSPGSIYHGNTITWIATGSGGTGSGRQYAFFRRRSGTSTWIPAVTSPAWQSSSAMSWTPSSSDVGTWDTSIWFRDANTPANANGYGYGAYYTPGTFQVIAPPTVTGTGSPASAVYGTAITWTATSSGGTGSARQYAFFRRKVGTSTWIPTLTAPAWQSSGVLSWTPSSSDIGTWDTSIWVRDADTPSTMNTFGFANYYTPGQVQVVGPPLTLSCSPSPASAPEGTAIGWTATAGGGHPPTIQYAFFRRRSGTGTSGWIPAVTSPAWQSSNAASWTPGSGDVGSWDTYVWVRDGNTPANMNTYGYAAGCNSGGVQVTAPLSLSGTGSPSSSPYGTAITWTATASGGYPSTIRYALFRRRPGTGTAGWIPSVSSPAWQTSNTLSWTPTSSDAGTWEIYIWVKDGNTPATMNTYGYAAGYNAGPVQVTVP